MIELKIPVIVEGRYDKSKLSEVISSTILTTDGFSVFNSREKIKLIKRLGEKGVIILSDSDGGGRLIRSKLKGMLDNIKVYNVYIPAIEGKERRKQKRSKDGLLGVEGINKETLESLFDNLLKNNPELLDSNETAVKKDEIDTAFLYEKGLCGKPDSGEKRNTVCLKIGLPSDMNAKAFKEAVNLISSKKEIEKILANETI